MILLLGANIALYLQHPENVSRQQRIDFSAELQEKVAMALMWMVCKPLGF